MAISIAQHVAGRFWPFIILVLIAVLYRIYTDISDANRLQTCCTDNLSMSKISDVKPLPYPVFLALVHYTTNPLIPLQDQEEIMATANILSQKAPCNFLIFGLGYDSLLWQTLNHGGNTVFLEDDPGWIAEMEKTIPNLKAILVQYTTKVSDADVLLVHARREKEECGPGIDLQQTGCKLAIKTLPAEVYRTKWDMVMIDAPKGYFETAYGRMSPIFTSAVLARKREEKESTHIVLHNVDRATEKEYSTEFFCSENLVKVTGRLAHFQIFGAGSSSPSTSSEFCAKASLP